VSQDLYHVVTNNDISDRRRLLGRLLVWGSFVALILTAVAQAADALHFYKFGFANWQPTLIMYFVWAVALCIGQVLMLSPVACRG